MNPGEALVAFAFTLLHCMQLLKAASPLLQVVDSAVLYYGLAFHAQECLKENRNIQELLDRHLAESLTEHEQALDGDDGEQKGSTDRRKKKDLKAMLDDPEKFRKIERYVDRLLQAKAKRERVLEIVASIKEDAGCRESWDDVERTVMSLVEVDQNLLDLLMEQIHVRVLADSPRNGVEGVVDAEQTMSTPIEEQTTILWAVDEGKAEIKDTIILAAYQQEKELLNHLKNLEPDLIKRAADALIGQNPESEQEIQLLLQSLDMKFQLQRQLDCYRCMVNGRACGAKQKDHDVALEFPNRPTVSSDHSKSMDVDSLAAVTYTADDLDICRGRLLSLIDEVLKKEETDTENYGDEIDSKKWMIEEVEKELGMVQSDIEKLLDGFASVAEDDTVEKVIQAAINLEQKVSGNSKLLQAVKSGRESLLEILIRAKGDRCGLALELAAMLGFDHIAKDLIAAGAVVSDRCLRFAVENGHADVLRSLLLSGVSIDDKCEKLLSDALRIGKKDIVKVLLEFGASIRDPDTRSSAIRHAVEDGNVDCVEALAVAGMLDSEDLINDLAELAVKKGHIDLYRYLLGMEWQKDQCSGRDVGESSQRLKSLLPFSDIINYAITNRTVSKRAMGSEILLDKHFPRASEICAIPGYGNVQKIPRDISRKCAKYCEKIIYESIDEENIRNYEFPLSLMRCGSSAEGTKVGLPDEMDFLFLLHTDAGKIVVKDIGEGYKIVEVPREHEDTLARKLISSGSKLFHDAFIGLVMTKKRHIDKIKSAQKIVTIGGSASSEWVLRYEIDADHSFDISVDLVPYVHIQGWPSDAVQSTWMMDSAALEAAGYALVAKPPHRSSAFGKKMKVVKQQRTWRISFAHLETRHLAMLEQRVKDVYITCKSLRDPDIGRVVFKDSNGLNISTSKDLVTSYMLKMVFMHNVAHFLQSRHTLAEMVYMVYNQLAECIDRWFVPFFWQPHVNVLEGLKHDPNRCKQAVKVMRSLATAWFIRDGMTDSVEEEDEKTGGVYPHLPTKTAAASRLTADHSPDEKTGSSEKDLDGDSTSFDEDDEDDFYEVLIYSRNPCDVGYTLCQLE